MRVALLSVGGRADYTLKRALEQDRCYFQKQMSKPRKRPRPADGSRGIAKGRPRTALYWALAVGLAATVVYLNALGNDFVLDDIRLIRDNVRIRSLANIPHFFVSSYWEIAGPQALYRPLVLVSYAANYAISGLSSSSYAAVNIALHAAVSLLLFALIRTMGGSLVAAGVVGLAFAVHPVHTEAVTGLSGRPELLSALFFLLAMHFHRLAATGGIGYRLAMLVSFACALLSKESAITLLLVLPVMDALVPAGRRQGQPVSPRARLLTDYVPLAIVALSYLAWRRWVLGGITIAANVIAPLDNPMVPATMLPLGESVGATRGQAIMTAFAVVAEYARLLAYPARLSPDYSYNQLPIVTNALDGRFMVGVGLVAAFAVSVAWLWRRSPIAAFGLAFMALTYSIVSNFMITIGTICAERLIYLPSAGLLIAAGIVAERLIAMGSTRRRLAVGVVAVLIISGAARTWTRNRDWRNEFVLWSAAIDIAPRSARVQSEYGRILMGLAEDASLAGRAAEAERLYVSAQTHFETAVKIYPSYSLPLDGLAMIHSLHQRFDEAAVHYERAQKAWPGNYASLTNWGSLLWERSKRDAAHALTLRQQGNTAGADALAHEADANCRQALDKVDRAIAMMPSYAHAHLIRAQILETYVGDTPGAIAEFEAVLRLMPNHPQRPLIEQELSRLRSREMPASVR
jgi:protein O-mannosyl-transferase